MRKLTNNKTFLLAVAIAGIAYAFIGHGVYASWSIVLAVLALYRWSRLIEGERNWKAIYGALTDYEEIIGGQLWIGRDAEILASDRLDDQRKSGPVCFEHICRTKNGAWFLFEVSVMHGRVIERRLEPCDEAKAKGRLRRHQDVYVRCFGQPTAA